MRLLIVAESGFPALSMAARGSGVVTTSATSAGEAIAMLHAEPYDVVLLDITMAVQDGLDFIRHLRIAQNDILILAIAGDKATDRITALALGADDAIPAAIDPTELRARLASLLRRRRNVSGLQLTFGNVTLCCTLQDAFVGGRQVKLTSREYALLEYLALRKGRAVSKEVLLAHLYHGAEEPEIKIIDVFICKTRRKLQRAGADSLITTVWGQGYAVTDQQSAGRHPANDQDHQQVA